MSGVAGLWHCDGQPVLAAELDRMAASVAPPDGRLPWRWLREAAGFSATLCRSISAASDGICCAAVEGSLHREGEELARLDLPPDASGAGIVLAAYHVHGTEALLRLRGSFAVVLYDARRQVLLLARDYFGLVPLYWVRHRESIACASYIRPLLALPGVETRVNLNTVADLQLWGSAHVNAETFFSGISAVAPGTTVALSPASEVVLKGADLDPHRRVLCRNTAEYAERLRDALQVAVARSLAKFSSPAVAVSGGLDSSAVLCLSQQLSQASRHQELVTGYTFSFGDCDDPAANEDEYVRVLERERPAPIRRIPWTPGWTASAREAIWAAEMPSYETQLNAEYSLLRACQADGRDVLLDGTFGDQALASQGYWADLLTGFRWIRLMRCALEHARWVAGTTPADWLADVPLMVLRRFVPGSFIAGARRARRLLEPDRRAPWYSQRLHKLAEERALSQPAPGVSADSYHAAEIYRLVHQRYYLQAWEAGQKRAAALGLCRAHPFTDPDLVQLVMSFPGAVVGLNGVFKGLFRESMRGILPETIRMRRSKGDFTGVDRASALRELDALAAGREFIAVQMDIVDQDKLIRHLPRLRRQLVERNDIFALREFSNLMALEVWLRVFFAGERPGISQVAAEVARA